MRFFVFFLCLLPVFASAGVLHRCFDPATKKTSFQDSPCPSTSVTKGGIEFRELSPSELESDRLNQVARTRALVQQQQADENRRSVISAPSVVESRPSRCGQMQIDKEAWCNRNDSYGRQRCHDMIYNFNKSCR